MRNPISRRSINWRWPVRLWFESGAEFWNWMFCAAAIVILTLVGLGIIHRPD